MSLIDTRSLVDRVYEYLLEEIITGAIQYGDTIKIKSVAEKLKVSTMPVREALKRLAFEQIIEIRPRSTCQVKVPTQQTVADTYELRELLELHALQKSIPHLDATRLGGLREIVASMKRLSEEKDPSVRERKAIGLDRRFHEELCRLAQSEVLDHYYRQLILHVNMTLIHKRTYAKLEKRYFQNHAELLRCLEQNPKGAVDILKRHFAETKKALFEA